MPASDSRLGVPGFDLSGRVALVTEATNATGRALALALAEAGAILTLASARREAAQEVASAVDEAFGPRPAVHWVNVADEDSVQGLVGVVQQLHGRLDILVNSAGEAWRGPSDAVSASAWDRLFALNLRSAFLAARAAAEPMRRFGYGRILNVACGPTERGLADAAALCATQGGLLQLTRALALEWAHTGIRVNLLVPGWLAEEGTAAPPDERLARFIPNRRLAQPQELGPLAVFLCSAAADYLTGQAFTVSGGLSARGP